MYQALANNTPNAILRPAKTLLHKALQHVITEDDGWKMLKHFLCKWAPNLGVKAEDTKKHIYDVRVISS